MAYTYDPGTVFRIKGIVECSANVMTHIVPEQIKEKYHDFEDFVDKSLAIESIHHGVANLLDGEMKIVNFDFHDPMTEEVLYCVMNRHPHWQSRTESNPYSWRMA